MRRFDYYIVVNLTDFSYLNSRRLRTAIWLVVIIVIGLPESVEAQTRRHSEHNDTLTFWERLSYRTNVVDWALMCPNIGIEFDVRGGDYNKWTIGVDGIYNWSTWQSNVSSTVFDLAQVTLETRRYYRTSRVGRGDTAPGEGHRGMVKWMQKLFGGKNAAPRSWRAYYWGIYVSGSQYSVKLSDIGHQGPAFSAGMSWGWGIPLYQIGKGTIDFDFGLRLGFVLTKSKAYTVDKENNCYPARPMDNTGWHLVPYPIPTDIHVSLVYRPFSIRHKYRKDNLHQDERENEWLLEMERRRESIRSEREARRDSMLAVVKMRAEAKKGLKERKRIAKKLKVSVEEVPLTPAEEAYEKWCVMTDAKENQERAIKAEGQTKKARKEEEQ